MRAFREELKGLKLKVHYEELGCDKLTYIESLKEFLKKNRARGVCFYEIEDKFFEAKILKALAELNIKPKILQSPMFLTGRLEFVSYLETTKKPFMKTFYERQRKRLKILVDNEMKPKGGSWTFDDENRLPLPKDIVPPSLPSLEIDKIVEEIKVLCEREFSDHPGDIKDYWLPIRRPLAKAWLVDFLENRFANFGPYEDALAVHSDFVFHSVLTPFLNAGLLTPAEIIEEVLNFSKRKKVPLPSLEGFIRQVIGWREFVRGIYQNFSEQQDSANFWGHKRRLSEVWYIGKTGVPQLDRTLNKVIKYGYCHHIERLMVLGNLMLLLEVEPMEAHKWFMEMFVDSSDWVMGPNVYGMALFSDGGIFATKPYICGSNYWRKMSKEKAGDWCDGMDGLYWGFVDRNRGFFAKNPRLSMAVRSLDKIAPERKTKIFEEGRKLRALLTVDGPQ